MLREVIKDIWVGGLEGPLRCFGMGGLKEEIIRCGFAIEFIVLISSKKSKKVQMADKAQENEIDAVISKCVDEIWSKYDDDGNGYLDKDETKAFVRDTLSDMADGAGFNDDDFDQCFREFDKDNSGTIEKQEMVQFIKQVAGL